MKILYIDLETYSEAPLAKTGAYRYVDDESFEILLLAYAVDDGDPMVVDMASGESVPAWLEDALTSDEYIKVAHNAQFEWACLQKHTGGKLVPEQWRCSAFMARHAGYPGSLEQAGAALGLAEDKKKLQTGKALIRYFCVPCKPTKANGGRTRNLPEHAPDKWEQFVTYNRQDVVTEREIVKKLSRFPIPGWLWRQFWTDLVINERGVALDLDLMEGALSISERERAALMHEAAKITGLENPNSLIQLQGWLREHGADLPDMTKDTVAKAAEDESLPPEAHRILQIRRELGKTSTKKYDAMRTCVCHDGRARGLLQFYGASRTGRFSGKLIQLQNLPRTYTRAIEFARECVQKADGDVLALMYGSVQDTLSQLIRTAFVPAPGHVFIDADFSAIEARVLAWLSGEDWVLQAFRDGKDLYCATASAMFHVPVEKHGQNAELRQKGKIAVLACIAGDEWVATDHGMVPIRDVTKDMKVYDGHGYVEHGGVIYRGVNRVIKVNGIRMTPDHLVLTDRGWVPARDCDGLRGPEGSQLVYEVKLPLLFDYDHVYDILNCGPDNRFTVVNRETREYIPVHNCGYGGGVGAMTAMGALDMGIPEDELPGIVDQWRQANANTKALWYEVQDAVDGAVYEYRESDVAGGKVRIGLEYNPDTMTKYLTVRLPSGRVLYYPSPVQTTNRFGSPSIAYMGVNQTTRAWTLIETYGAKIVENITQAVARDLLAEAIERLEAAGLPVVFHVHDEVVIDVARFGTDKEMLDRVCRIMSEVPEWAKGLPLAADGWVGLFFTKD